jgi:hypothetical protein
VCADSPFTVLLLAAVMPSQAVAQVDWEDAYYRKDIGWRAIARQEQQQKQKQQQAAQQQERRPTAAAAAS